MNIDLKTKEGLEYIIEQKKEGKTLSMVAAELKTTANTVRDKLKKHHNVLWSELPPIKQYSEDIINEKGGLSYIIQKKNDGYTKQKIAEEIGYTAVTTIDNYLQKHEVRWMDIGHKRTVRSTYTFDEEKEIIQKVTDLINQGFTSMEISEELGIHNTTIRNIFRKHKIPYKPIKPWERDKLCDIKKTNINRSKTYNRTGFYRVRLLGHGTFVYTTPDGVQYYSKNILDLRSKVVDAGLDWIIVNRKLANHTLSEALK